jgi:acyl carrier protein
MMHSEKLKLDTVRDVRRPDVDEITEWLVRNVAASLGTDADDVAIEKPFHDFGLSSMEALRLSGELGLWLGVEISPTVAWYYPTIDELARYLASS